jgi:ATP-dependent protease ClpP protease subunit
MKLSIILLFLYYATIYSKSITLTSTNHISILGQITDSGANKFIKDIQPLTTKDIYIYIDSPGGEVHAGENIIQYMNYKTHQNHTLLCIANQAMSMAFHIFQHCSRRLVLQNTILMQHQMSLQTDGSLENINNYLGMINTINERLINIESIRLKITPEEYKYNIMSDWWLYGEESIVQNAADELINSIGCDTQLLEETNIIIEFGIMRKESNCPLIDN